MHSTLIYSFRTNKLLDKFKGEGVEVFVFGRLHEDLEKFKTLIHTTKPTHIIGLAEVRQSSRFEKIAVNKFGKRGTINKAGKDFYSMHIPADALFPLSSQPSKSFCNWTMYKIAEYIANDNIKLSFVHFNRGDFEKVCDFIKNAR